MSTLNVPAALINHIAESEGFRSHTYQDQGGLAHIGYGTNLEVGISEAEASLLLAYRLHAVVKNLEQRIPGFADYSDSTRFILIAMGYNLGVGGLLQFKNMFAAINDGDFDRAANEMADSRWFNQTGARSTRLAEVMRAQSI